MNAGSVIIRTVSDIPYLKKTTARLRHWQREQFSGRWAEEVTVVAEASEEVSAEEPQVAVAPEAAGNDLILNFWESVCILIPSRLILIPPD